MAKKRKKTGNQGDNKSQQVKIGTTANFGTSKKKPTQKPEVVAREAMESALNSKFRAFYFVVQANADLLSKSYFELEVDKDGNFVSESFDLLKKQAEKILTCNFQPQGSEREDLTWAQAYWSNESGLDPHIPFTVGLCVSRRPDLVRQSKTQAIITCRETLAGLTITPNQEGKHLDIPGAGVLFTRDLVLVRRGEFNLGTCSIMNALQNTHNAKWSNPHPGEKAAWEAEEMVRKAALAEEAKAEEAFGMFNAALEHLKDQEEQAEKERLDAIWSELVLDNGWTSRWEGIRSPLNAEFDEQEEEIQMVLGLVRPGTPHHASVSRFASLYRESVPVFAEWIKDTYHKRSDMTLAQCVVLLRNEVDGLVSMWFTDDGEAAQRLKSLESYPTQEDLKEAITAFPGALTAANDFLARLDSKIEEMSGKEKVTT